MVCCVERDGGIPPPPRSVPNPLVLDCFTLVAWWDLSLRLSIYGTISIFRSASVYPSVSFCFQSFHFSQVISVRHSPVLLLLWGCAAGQRG